jgi:hypothetical protein
MNWKVRKGNVLDPSIQKNQSDVKNNVTFDMCIKALNILLWHVMAQILFLL